MKIAFGYQTENMLCSALDKALFLSCICIKLISKNDIHLVFFRYCTIIWYFNFDKDIQKFYQLKLLWFEMIIGQLELVCRLYEYKSVIWLENWTICQCKILKKKVVAQRICTKKKIVRYTSSSCVWYFGHSDCMLLFSQNVTRPFPIFVLLIENSTIAEWQKHVQKNTTLFHAHGFYRQTTTSYWITWKIWKLTKRQKLSSLNLQMVLKDMGK